MPLLVSDSNIFIDFEEGGILDALFKLDETICVPFFLRRNYGFNTVIWLILDWN